MTPSRPFAAFALAVHTVFIAFAAASLGACAVDEAFRKPATPAERQAGGDLAARMIAALGGADAFGKLRVISFDFVPRVAGAAVGKRHHDWDPQRGWSHVVKGEGADRFEAWIDLATRKGAVHIGGQPVTEPKEFEEQAAKAYGAWVNDTYWLISPFKVFDPGVHRAAIGNRLRISFEPGTGLTPGDAYLYSFHPTGLVSGWSYLLESGRTGAFEFKDPVTLEGVTFFRMKEGGAYSIALENISVSLEPRDHLFGPLAAH